VLHAKLRNRTSQELDRKGQGQGLDLQGQGQGQGQGLTSLIHGQASRQGATERTTSLTEEN